MYQNISVRMVIYFYICLFLSFSQGLILLLSSPWNSHRFFFVPDEGADSCLYERKHVAFYASGCRHALTPHVEPHASHFIHCVICQEGTSQELHWGSKLSFLNPLSLWVQARSSGTDDWILIALYWRVLSAVLVLVKCSVSSPVGQTHSNTFYCFCP